VRCSGNEEDLWQCGYRGIGQTGCSESLLYSVSELGCSLFLNKKLEEK